MAKGYEVLTMLRPNGGWVIVEDNFDSIRWDEGVAPLTKAQYEAGFVKYDAWKAEQDAQAAVKKAAAEAKLAALGLTSDDFAALGL